MDEKIKLWEKEAREIFVGTDDSINLGPFINGYVAACQKLEKKIESIGVEFDELHQIIEEQKEKIKELEKQLSQEIISVNELSLANQDLHEKIEELEKQCAETGIGDYKADYFIGKPTETGMLRERIKTLEKGMKGIKKHRRVKNEIWNRQDYSIQDILEMLYKNDEELYKLIGGDKDSP